MAGIPIPHRRWQAPPENEPFDRSRWFDQLLQQRGISDSAARMVFLDPSRYHPASPFDLPGMQSAAEILLAAISRGERICIWGDFDVDGQTSTAILASGLTALGAEILVHIPVRAVESHGVNLPQLQKQIDQGAQLLLTCDTGITAHTEIEYARERGLQVIVTDHHTLGQTLPQADTVVNPHLLAEGHPLGTLSGAGVAWKLVEALYSTAGKPAPREMLDLAALGLVADMAELRQDTRWMVQKGLEVLRENRRVGLQELLKMAEVNPASLTEEEIGFQIAPRLNALGRLGDANPAVELFTTDDAPRARLIVNQMEGMNARRKMLTDQVFQAALEMLERNPALLETNALVLSHQDWPAGVVGIVAGRLVELFHKPVILFSETSPESAGGSARSIAGVNIIAAISRQSALLTTYGGHPMAAGMSLRPDLIPEFRQALHYTIAEMTGGQLPEPILQIDLWCPLADLDLELAQNLERLSPFGQGNPAPVFAARDLKIETVSPVGRTKEHLQVTVSDAQGQSYPLIWWQGAGLPQPSGRFDLAYRVRSSTQPGREVEIEWVDARWQPEEGSVAGELNGENHLPFGVEDSRKETSPRRFLDRLAGEPGVEIWAEGQNRPPASHLRSELTPAEILVIWTIPPAPDVLVRAIRRVRPRKVILFACPVDVDLPQAFLSTLAGKVKGVHSRSAGQTTLENLAGSLAQSEATVTAGLRWLEAKGMITVVSLDERGCQLAVGSGEESRDAAAAAESRLRRGLEESAAYRDYYRTARLEALFPPAAVFLKEAGKPG